MQTIAFGFADLNTVGIGARPLALGRAYTALSADGSGIFTNPAGLTDFPRVKFISMMGKLIEDVNYFAIGVADTFPIGTFGIGYINASTGKIPLTTLTNTGSGPVISLPYDYTDYASSIYYLTYAVKPKREIGMGASLKFYNQNFSIRSGSMDGAKGSGMEVDLGAKWRPKSWLTFGAALKNALPASFGGKFIWDRNDREEGIPAVLHLGTYMKFFGPSGLKFLKNQNIAIMLEAEMSPRLERQTLYHAGCEWWITSGLALRGGVDQDFKAADDNSLEIQNNLTLGVGIKAAGFTFDYAYHEYGELDSNISHFFSVGYIGFDEDIRTALRISRYDDEGLFPVFGDRPALTTFTDVPDSHWARDPIEYLATLGIMQGYPEQTFKPENSISRAELAAILVRAKGFKVKEGEKSTFIDMAVNHWATPYVNVALKRKYISGYPDKTFRPSKKLNRAEAMVIFSKFGGLYIPKKLSQNPYNDVGKDAWYAPSIAAAKKAGLLEYVQTDSFSPLKELTRAEACEIISKTKFGIEAIKKLITE